MTWNTYTSGTEYLTQMIQEYEANARVYDAKSVPIMEWFNGQGIELNSYFISYEGYTPQGREDGRGPLAMAFNIYWHGRGLDEAVMRGIHEQIRSNATFRIDSETQRASVTGGRYLLLDRGFDTYQLEIQIT